MRVKLDPLPGMLMACTVGAAVDIMECSVESGKLRRQNQSKRKHLNIHGLEEGSLYERGNNVERDCFTRSKRCCFEDVAQPPAVTSFFGFPVISVLHSTFSTFLQCRTKPQRTFNPDILSIIIDYLTGTIFRICGVPLQEVHLPRISFGWWLAP